MTDDSMAFWERVGQQGGEDVLRSLGERVLEQLMEFEVTNRIGVTIHERAERRETHRNGYRERALHTRLGTLDLRVPKLRQGTYFPAFVEPRRLTDELETRSPKMAALMDPAEAEVLAHLHVLPAHRVKLHSNNTLERLNKAVKRRANVVGIFPNEASIRP
jgi:transposase-like protein